MVLVMLLVSQLSTAQTILTDPLIPIGELTTFRVSYGDDTFVMTSQVALNSTVGEAVYQFRNESVREKVTVDLSRSTLSTRAMLTIGTIDGMQFESATAIAERSGEQTDRIEAVNLNDLMLKLRGFPFSSGAEIPVLFITGNRGNDASHLPLLSLVGKEKLQTGKIKSDAYKLELVFGNLRRLRALGLAPRTFLWYGVEPPHVLLRVEITEVPGSPRWLLEAVDYAGRKEE